MKACIPAGLALVALSLLANLAPLWFVGVALAGYGIGYLVGYGREER